MGKKIAFFKAVAYDQTMFETENLIVKFWSPELAESFYELTQDDGFNAFPITIYRQKSLESAIEWVTNMQKQNVASMLGKYAVIEKASGKLIGMGGLSPWTHEGEDLIDITYRLHSSATGRGLGMELARGLVNYGFNEINLKQITATITPDNIPSLKMATKLGMKFDSHIILLGVPTDLYRLRR